MTKNTQLTVQSTTVTVTKFDDKDYICITEMAKAKTDAVRATDVIKNRIRTRATLEFPGTWERIYTPNFKVVEFDQVSLSFLIYSYEKSTNAYCVKNLLSER
ncbi:MAG: KilA-N domain-containing protein [Ekhidna sp.]|nr:KilA-N domain-containing protein [Ekhidna sp.]MBC6427379.1 KilA-N domain-containing protein [Ekhidna sp.]